MSFSIIPIRELASYQRKTGTILIDLRQRKRYAEGHISGAVNIPYERWEKEKDSWKHHYDTVIFYCERGNQSMYAAKEMNKKGYRAISIAGGYQGYRIYQKQKGNETPYET